MVVDIFCNEAEGVILGEFGEDLADEFHRLMLLQQRFGWVGSFKPATQSAIAFRKEFFRAKMAILLSSSAPVQHRAIMGDAADPSPKRPASGVKLRNRLHRRLERFLHDVGHRRGIGTQKSSHVPPDRLAVSREQRIPCVTVT